MRCWKCGNDNNDGTKFCLYCGTALERISPDSDLGKALRKIYDDFGHEAVFKDSRCLSSSLSDLVSDSELFVYSVEHVYRVGLGSVYESQLSKAGKPDESFYTRVKRIITVDAGLSESKADELISMFDEMIGWQTSERPTKNVTNPVESIPKGVFRPVDSAASNTESPASNNANHVGSAPEDDYRPLDSAKPDREKQVFAEKTVPQHKVSSTVPVREPLPKKIEGLSVVTAYALLFISITVIFVCFSVFAGIGAGMITVPGLIMSYFYYANIRKGVYSYSLVNGLRIPTILLIIYAFVSITFNDPNSNSTAALIMSWLMILVPVFVLVKLKINNNLSLKASASQSESGTKPVPASSDVPSDGFMDVGFCLCKDNVAGEIRHAGFQKGYIEFKDGFLILHKGSEKGSAGYTFLFGVIGAMAISENKKKMDVLIRVSQNMIESADVIDEADKKYVLIRLRDIELAVSGSEDVVYRTYYWARK